LNKGDIYLVDFNPAKGGEIGKLRPAVVMSGSKENSIFQTVIVMPLSTIIVKDNLPYRFLITKRDQLKLDSDACIYEIRTLSKTRLKEKIASINKIEMRTIKDSLCQLV